MRISSPDPRENPGECRFQRTATPDHLQDFGLHGSMPDRFPRREERSGGTPGRRVPGSRHPSRTARSRQEARRVLRPPAGLLSPASSLFCLPADSAATYPVCRSGGMYSPRILFGFVLKTRELFGSSLNPKPSGGRFGPGYPDRGSFLRSGSGPERRRTNSRTASGSRTPRIEAPLLISKHP
ncbi:hypothetical protein L21_0799 [Methanoculleus chikugoensis]|jgi:hypothetical protein|uniref:Uncharacterized protein n=1 Tax=Methanoculleus chikugoensis TaxID=118126 RepID=A0A1M4MJ91_9EURY|nr:hypothetical protein L21_0799 [Methanoculleus chikugoensis]